MNILKIPLFIFFFMLSGCSDYQTGYQAAYAGNDKNHWIVFGRGVYLKGYESGLAEKFQQDWILENPVDTDALHCPSIVLRVNPLMFLPAEYSEISQDIYSNFDN